MSRVPVRARPFGELQAEARAAAVPVYRALRAAGAAGLTRQELAEAAGTSVQEVLLLVHWLRFKGVDVWVGRSRSDPAGGTKLALRSLLPASWDALI